MSIDRCQTCGAFVDTDNEPEAYVQIADMRRREEWICLCRSHREEYEQDEPHMPPDWHPTPAQQAIMDAAQDEDET